MGLVRLGIESDDLAKQPLRLVELTAIHGALRAREVERGLLG